MSTLLKRSFRGNGAKVMLSSGFNAYLEVNL